MTTNTDFSKDVKTSIEVIRLSVFDINVNVIEEYKEVMPGEDLRAMINISNITKIRGNTTIEYIIKNVYGDILLSEEESVILKTPLNFIKNFSGLVAKIILL